LFKIILLLCVSIFLHAETYIYGIPETILLHLIETESNFNPNAANHNKNETIDYGLMQLNSSNIEYFTWKFNNGKPFDPMNVKDNLFIGCAYLYYLYEYTGTWYDAIWAYNAGPGNWNKRIMPQVTKYKLNHIFTALLRRDFMAKLSIHRTPEMDKINRGSLEGWEPFVYGDAIAKEVCWIPQILKQPWGWNQGIRIAGTKSFNHIKLKKTHIKKYIKKK
jgi:hypothetical protein